MIPVTPNKLRDDFARIGVQAGQIIMLHVSVKAIGWIVGGPDMVIQSLLDVITPQGTLMMMVGWEDNPYEFANWPKAKQEAYLNECPPFDPTRSRACRKWSILTEYLRTWPGAYRSVHPEKSFVAVGAKASWITADHPLQHGFGLGSPLSKLYESKGKVLQIGTPLSILTVLHYSEYLADIPDKKIVRYKMPILQNGKKRWIDIEELDSNDGIIDHDGPDYFESIAQEYINQKKECTGKIGAAQARFLDVVDLVEYGKKWMENKF